MLRAFIFVIFWAAMSAAAAFAQSSNFYCEDRELGEHFYCQPPAPEEPGSDSQNMSLPPSAETKRQDFEAFKVKLGEARALAVYTGETEDVRAYMELQKQAGDMSSKFMTEYQVLGWQNPDLSYTAAVPISSGAKRAYRAERRGEVEKAVSKLNHRYGIYYFYSKNCPACRTFSPVVKMLSDRHQLTVIPIAKRGHESIEWPGTKVENGIAERLGLYGDVTPALVLFDTKERVGVPISYGSVALTDIENRIYMLTRKEDVKFLGGSDDTR